ncbi:MAG: hypothetical protein FJ388_22275 [Verrucomicrobia bacterium]|nr:hypothetical protein [Verrucomicrobiota bacterium]
MRSPFTTPPPTSANAEDFRAVFINRVHRLLQVGYSRLNPADFADSEEPDISGEIAREIETFLDEPPAEDWLRFYEVFDDPPVHEAPARPRAARRLGKSRRRVDIGIKCSQTSPRTRFRFEAKRLCDSGSVKHYLGDSGLGRFVAGFYAATDSAAGMLGYVQRGEVAEWADKLSAQVREDATSLPCASGARWQLSRFQAGPANTFQSKHRRRNGTSIEIYHTLFRFH